MARKELTDKLSIYIPQTKMTQRPVERLIKMGKKKDRSINYLVVEAIIAYLDREEKKGYSNELLRSYRIPSQSKTAATAIMIAKRINHHGYETSVIFLSMLLLKPLLPPAQTGGLLPNG